MRVDPIKDKDKLRGVLGGIRKQIQRQFPEALLTDLASLLGSSPAGPSNVSVTTPEDATPPLPPEADRDFCTECTYQNMVGNWQYCHQTETKQLEYAARWGLVEMIRRLLTKNSNLLSQCDPLPTACLSGHIEAARVLIEDFGADVNQQSSDGDYAIHSAVSSGDLAIVQLLLKHHARLDVKSSFYSETPLQTCQRELKGYTGRIETKYIPIIKTLIAHNADTSQPHGLYKTTLQQDIHALHNKSGLCDELKALLSSADPSVHALSHIMQNHHIHDDKMQDLLTAFACLNTNDPDRNTNNTFNGSPYK